MGELDEQVQHHDVDQYRATQEMKRAWAGVMVCGSAGLVHLRTQPP